MNWGEILKQIPDTVSAAAIGAISVIVSSVLSILISRGTAKSEIKKLQITWEREDMNQFNIEFSKMVTAITLYLSEQSAENYKNAIEMINIVRVKAPDDFSKTLDAIYNFMSEKDSEFREDYLRESKMLLGDAIEQCRKHYRENAPRYHRKPVKK